MGRVKGIRNKSSLSRLIASSLSPEERIKILANLIIDRILEDQKNGQKILKTLL